MPDLFTDTVPGSLQALHTRLKVVEVGMAEQNKQLAEILTTVKDVRDVQTAGRVVTRFLKWVGSIAAGAALLIAFAQNGFHWPGK